MSATLDLDRKPNSVDIQEQIAFDEYFKTDTEKIDSYFRNVAKRYQHKFPIRDSLVRLDQETEIAKLLRNKVPVLIRGNWRIGKTSMLRSMEKHHFGTDNTLFIDIAGANTGYQKPLEVFNKHFCLNQIVEFIINLEFGNAETAEDSGRESDLKNQISSSQKSPFEFLNDYLDKRGQKVYILLDEIYCLAESPEKLKLLSRLKELTNFHLAIVVHRMAPSEDLFKEVFQGFETYYMRALTLAEVGVLIRKPLEGSQVNFTDDAILRIFELTGGRPMEINIICHALLHPDSEHKSLKFMYRAADIDAFVGKKNYEIDLVFSSAFLNYIRVYKESLNDEERSIVKTLIQMGTIAFSEIDPEKVQPLIDTAFVVRDEENGVFRFNGVLFQRVIADLLGH